MVTSLSTVSTTLGEREYLYSRNLPSRTRSSSSLVVLIGLLPSVPLITEVYPSQSQSQPRRVEGLAQWSQLFNEGCMSRTHLRLTILGSEVKTIGPRLRVLFLRRVCSHHTGGLLSCTVVSRQKYLSSLSLKPFGPPEPESGRPSPRGGTSTSRSHEHS